MTRTFDATKLQPHDPTSPDWALAWVRVFSGDRPNTAGSWPLGSQDDEVWLGWLSATVKPPSPPAPTYAIGGEWPMPLLPVPEDTATRYRPHEAAASAILANPDWVLRESISGFSEERRPAGEVAAAIRAAGRWVDNLSGMGGQWPPTVF